MLAPLLRARPTSCSARASSRASRTASSISGTRSATGSSRPLSNMFTNLNLTDMETCYKAFRRRGDPVDRDRRGPLRLRARDHGQGRGRRGWRICEVSIGYAGRTYAEGKKIGWRDGIRARVPIGRYSNVWRGVRGHLDRVPDRSIPPAEFDDADLELSDVLRSLEEATTTPTGSTASSSRISATRCSRSAPATASSPTACAAVARVTATDLSTDCVEQLATALRGLRPKSTCCLVDIAATRRRPPLRLGHPGQRARAHRRRRERARQAPRLRCEPGGRVCMFVPGVRRVCTPTSTSGSGTAAVTGAHSSSTAFDRAGFAIIDARATSTPSARCAWWVLPASSARSPTRRWSVAVYDRLVVPTLRRLEAGRRPAVRPVAVLRRHRSRRSAERLNHRPAGRGVRFYGNDWPTSRRCLSCALA